jgi:hypothetical protein
VQEAALVAASAPGSLGPWEKTEKTMKRVKGTALVYVVKTIRANKSGVYDQYLAEEDRAIVRQRIMPSAWYPYETFKRCFNAVFEVAGNRDFETVRQMGRLYGEVIISEIYPNTVKKGDPLYHVQAIPVYIRTFFDFARWEGLVEKPNQVVLTLRDCEPDFPAIYHFFRGWFEKMAELGGGENARCEFVKMGWADESMITSYRISWD